MMMQIGVYPTRYISVPICSDRNVNSMFGFTNINRINILELYLNNKSRLWNSSNMDFTWVSSNIQMTTKASQVVSLYGLGGNTRN